MCRERQSLVAFGAFIQTLCATRSIFPQSNLDKSHPTVYIENILLKVIWYELILVICSCHELCELNRNYLFISGITSIFTSPFKVWSGKAAAQEIWARCYVQIIKPATLPLRGFYVSGQVSQSWIIVLWLLFKKNKFDLLKETFENKNILFGFFFVSWILMPEHTSINTPPTTGNNILSWQLAIKYLNEVA